MPKPSTFEDVMARVDTTDEHWLWTGKPNDDGYGQLTFQGHHWAVHRFIWATIVGPIPKGLVLDHLCRVRLCCRVEHLELVTQKENVARSQPYRPKKYAKRDACRQGHLKAEHQAPANKSYDAYCRVCRALSEARRRRGD